MATPSGVDPIHALHYLEAAPDAIVAVDDDGVIRMANQQAERLFGYDTDALVGHTIEMLVPDSVQLGHRAHRTRYRAAPRVRQMGDTGARLSARRSDGVLVPVEVALSPVDVDGQHMVLAVVRDVTERVQMEAEQEVIRQSLDAVDDAVFMFEPDTLRFTYVNAGAERQTGYRRAELVGGMTPLHIKPEFDEPEFRRMLAPLTAEKLHSSTFTTVHRTKTGHDIPVEINLSYPATSSATDRPMVALVRDITDRQAAERRLLESEQAFRSAFDDAGVPMAIVDLGAPETREVIEGNQALADMLGYDVEELPGLSMASITHPDDQAADLVGTTDLAAGDDYRTEKRYRRSDGTYVWGALHASLIHGPDGEPRSLAHIVDISRRIAAEADRDRREHQLQALAAIRKAALDEAPTGTVLDLVADSARTTLEADYCFVATPNETGVLICRSASSDAVAELVGKPLPVGALSAKAMATGEIATVASLKLDTSDLLDASPTEISEIGPTMIVPLSAASSIEGVLVAVRDLSTPPFNDADIESARAVAAEAAVTMVLARARGDRRRMFLAEDRERIARDLHDLVIQRIFATGMSLQAAVGNPDRLETRAMETVDELDNTIGVIREAIFQLTRDDDSLAGDIERLVDRRRAVGRHHITYEVEGDLDTLPVAVREQLLPTLNELLSNAERHAHAETVDVRIVVGDDELALTVIDDGVGVVQRPQRERTGLGLRNLTSRAGSLGGSMTFGPRRSGLGTEVLWRVPLSGS